MRYVPLPLRLGVRVRSSPAPASLHHSLPTMRNRERWIADVVWVVNWSRRHRARLKLASDADDNPLLPNDPLHSPGVGGHAIGRRTRRIEGTSIITL